MAAHLAIKPVSVVLSAAVAAIVAALNTRAKKAAVLPPPIPEPIPGPRPGPIGPIPGPTPIQPEPVPGPIPKIPGTDRPFGDNMIVVDAPSGLRVHAAPSVSSPVVATARNGSTVTVFEFDVAAPPPPADKDGSERFGWARIRVGPTQPDGFVAARFLSSSGASGLAEKERQEKERQESTEERPILTLGPWGYYPSPRYRRRHRFDPFGRPLHDRRRW